MFETLQRKLFADPYSAPSLIRRLLVEQVTTNWRAYATVLSMMGIMAVSIAAMAYLIGHAVNEAYVSRNITAVIAVCIIVMVVSALRGAASYFQAVNLARINNRIVGDNQRRLFE